MKVTLRPAHYDDITAMYHISSRAHLTSLYDQLIPQSERTRFEDRYQLSQHTEQAFTDRFMKWLDDPFAMAIVAVVSGVVVGYTIAKHSDGTLLLSGLFVDPEFQSQGIGSELFAESLRWRRSEEGIQLIVLRDNTRAKRLYERHGFRVTRLADHSFYGVPQDVMEWHGMIA